MTNTNPLAPTAAVRLATGRPTREQVSDLIDAKAFRFEAPSPVQFIGAAIDGKIPFAMVLRSPKPIWNWFWGMIVHDMAGFIAPPKNLVSVDYCHDYDEILGYGDSLTADAADGLKIGGFLVPFADDDRATEIAFKGQRGVPYEASLDWSDFGGGNTLIEEVGPGVTVQVNGFDFTGPGYVVRKWTCTAAAICPHGNDPNTSTALRGATTDDKRLSTVFFSSHPIATQAMSTDTKKAPDQPPAETKLAPTGDDLRAELKRFVAKFGAENGAKWFGEGKPYHDALESHVDALNTQHKAALGEVEELKKKLAAAIAAHGEETPTKFTDDEKPAKKKLASYKGE